MLPTMWKLYIYVSSAYSFIHSFNNWHVKHVAYIDILLEEMILWEAEPSTISFLRNLYFPVLCHLKWQYNFIPSKTFQHNTFVFARQKSLKSKLWRHNLGTTTLYRHNIKITSILNIKITSIIRIYSWRHVTSFQPMIALDSCRRWDIILYLYFSRPSRSASHNRSFWLSIVVA